MCPGGISIVNQWACKVGSAQKKKQCKKEVGKLVEDVVANKPLERPCWVLY